MTYIATRPVIITEGHGDIRSASSLLRRTLEYKERFDVNLLSPPIRSGGLSRLKRDSELERFVTLASLREGRDSIIIAVDCDDGCAAQEAHEMTERIRPLAERHQVKIATSFFVREFECLFLSSIDEVAARNQGLGIVIPPGFNPAAAEQIRDAKGTLSRMIPQGSYKPTRDQNNLVYSVDLAKLEATSRTFRHLLSTLDFLSDPNSELVYPTRPT